MVLPIDIEDYNRFKIYQSDFHVETSNLKMAEKHLKELEQYSKQNGYSKKQGSSAYYYLMVLHQMSLADYFNLKGDFATALNHINLGIQKATDYYKMKTGAEPPLSVMAPLYNTRNFSLVMHENSNISSSDILEQTKLMEEAFNSNQHRFVSISRILHSKTIAHEFPKDAINELLSSLESLNQWFQGTNINKDQVLAHLSLANIYLRVNEPDKSILHLNNAFNISKEIFKDLRNAYVHETLNCLVSSNLMKDALYEAQNTYNTHKEIFSELDPRSKKVFNKILNHYSIKEKS